MHVRDRYCVLGGWCITGLCYGKPEAAVLALLLPLLCLSHLGGELNGRGAAVPVQAQAGLLVESQC